jgi:hypothetical protein
MALAEADIVTAVNAITINGQAMTPQMFGTLLQYAANAMIRDFYLVQAAGQEAANTANANTGATALANSQNASATAQGSIATLLSGITI